MHRLIRVAVATAALSIPASVALVGVPAVAGAAGSSVSCASVKGTITGSVTIGKCTPKNKADKSASGAAASLTSGGTITWSPSGQTTMTSLTVSSPGQGPCKKNTSEYIATGSVTGGTSTYTHSGDAVSVKVCVSSKTGKISIAPGTTAAL